MECINEPMGLFRCIAPDCNKYFRYNNISDTFVQIKFEDKTKNKSVGGW